MAKHVAIINGVAGKVNSICLLMEFFKRRGFAVEYLEIMDEKVDVNKIKLKNKPDVLVGFSLGGMVVISLAQQYPQAKLIMVASGCREDASNKYFKLLAELIKNESFMKLTKLVLSSPTKWLVPVYMIMCPCPNREDKKDYEEDMKINLELFRKVSIRKWKEILKYGFENDLRSAARNIDNKSLIISGKNDVIMPSCLGGESNKLIKKSRLTETTGGHFSVISKDNLIELEKFIEST